MKVECLLQECQDKVSNDIKVFALKIIAEINRRGKSLMEDLNALCDAKKQQLDQKTEDINLVCRKLDHAVNFVEYCTEKGSPEALLYSKRIVVKQLKSILVERCDVPNPNHKLDIRFQWDQNFTSMVPKQGMLLIDGINFHTASKSAQQNWIQGMGLMNGQPSPQSQQQQQVLSQQQQKLSHLQQFKQQQSSKSASGGSHPHQHHSQQHPSRHGQQAPSSQPMMNLTREQQQQRPGVSHGMNKSRIQQYTMGNQQQMASQGPRPFLQPGPHPGQISPTVSSAQGSMGRSLNLMHPPGYLGNQGSGHGPQGPQGAQYNPHQSSAISSSDPHNRNRQGERQMKCSLKMILSCNKLNLYHI